jgi:hypothetical protein
MSLAVKTCTGCKEIKTLDCFNKQATGKYGVHSECKVCHKERNRVYNNANRDKVNARQKKWRLANLEKEKQSALKYKLANPEKEKERQRKYREENADKKKEANRKWAASNPENNRHRANVRRVRKLSNGVYKILDKDLRKLYKSSCFYCGSKSAIQADHVIPIARGGTHSIGNLVPACAKCNQSKGSKFLAEWKASLTWVA